jgi:excisionase family DNA binding protein
MSKYYSCAQVAEILSVKVLTVQDWIRNGKLKAYKIGKMYRIDQNQIDEFISSKAITNKSK